ncbi:MAG: hypothetical protein ACE5FI_08615 [Anaerolineales bacterium]
MIEREILLKLARDFAENAGAERPTLVAAYLAGSVARSEPPLGDATDLDIGLIDYDPPAEYERYLRISDNVLFDCVYYSPADFQDKPFLRRHPLHGPTLYDAVPLYDPRHTFDLIQAAVRGQFDQPDNVYARARHAYARAYEHFDAIERYRTDPVPVPLDRDEIQHLLGIFEWAATAILMIAFRPHTYRRQLMQFEAAALQLGCSDVYAFALQGLGYAGLTDEEIAAFGEQWHEIYAAATHFHQGPWDEDARLHPAREHYYRRGFETLAEAGHALNSMLLLEHTLGGCVNQILTHARPEDAVPYLETYAAWLSRTGKGDAESFAERVTQAASLLDMIDEVLITWARAEGATL